MSQASASPTKQPKTATQLTRELREVRAYLKKLIVVNESFIREMDWLNEDFKRLPVSTHKRVHDLLCSLEYSKDCAKRFGLGMKLKRRP
jgi:hypothetical protein